MSSDIGAFIFDMDGTLVDNMPVHVQIWLELLAASGATVTAEQFHERASGRTNPEILELFLGDRLSPAERVEWAERKEAHYREVYRPDLRAIEGLHDFLAEARRLGVPMALGTSAEWPNIEFVLKGLELPGFFDTVISGADVRRGKPDPEMFLTAAARLGVAPERCVVFEDSRAGVEAALAAGMRVVVVATAPGAEEYEGRPGVVRVVPDYTELEPRELLAG